MNNLSKRQSDLTSQLSDHLREGFRDGDYHLTLPYSIGSQIKGSALDQRNPDAMTIINGALRNVSDEFPDAIYADPYSGAEFPEFVRHGRRPHYQTSSTEPEWRLKLRLLSYAIGFLAALAAITLAAGSLLWAGQQVAHFFGA